MTTHKNQPPQPNLQGDSQSLRDVLWAIRQSVKNARGAVESNQVVDKDVRGTLTGVIAKIDGALDLLHAPPPVQHVDGEAEIASVVQSVNEWDDRTSPDDYPDHLLITSEELAEILRNFAATLEGSAE
ncbi:MAG TPA: hypothetical protein VFY63_17160 [Pseudorhizobium sp.]|nr:hypothetical protein [Pseudorhizobium sp.]